MSVLIRDSGFATVGPGTLILTPYYSTGPVFWVDSLTGSDDNTGIQELLPKATLFGLDGALSVTPDAASALVVVKKTHRETVGTDFIFSIPMTAVTIVGLGSGTDRPQIRADGTITSTEACTRLENLYFVASGASAQVVLSGAGGCEVRNCQFDSGPLNTGQSLTLENADHCLVTGCTFKATARPAGGTQSGLTIAGPTDGPTVEHCTFDGTSVGWSSGYAGTIINDSTTAFRLRDITLQNYSKFGVMLTGPQGYVSGVSKDATSEFVWVEVE